MSIKNEYVKYFLTLPLIELRRRQDIAKPQMLQAYTSKNTKGLENLQDVMDSLSEAINQKVFKN